MVNVCCSFSNAKKQTHSKVWSYFIQIPNFRAQCNLCKKFYKFNNTTNLLDDLLKKYPAQMQIVDLDEQNIKEFDRPTSSTKNAVKSKNFI